VGSNPTLSARMNPQPISGVAKKRSSVSGLVTVIGGDGYIGRYAVHALLRDGWRVRVSSRTPKRSYDLKPQANLGQIAWLAADIFDPISLDHACEGADAVVNLAGSFADMDRVHVTGGGNVAKAAAKAGATHYVHMSAIGADRDSPSVYGRSKAGGEDTARDAMPDAVILRPSVVFGREDQFINRFAGLMRMLPFIPIIGGKTKFQPVFAGDVGHAISSALKPVHNATVFELGGPDIMSMADINRWIAKQIGRDPVFIDMPDAAAAAMAKLTGWLPGAPMSWDQWLMLQKDNVADPAIPGLADLGIAARSLDLEAEGWLVQYRKHGRFAVNGTSK
jgi:uncharacterized protein YbjT (DUF2867 family)